MKNSTTTNTRRIWCFIGALLISWACLTPQTQAACGTATQTALLAGQHIPAGSVAVENDEQFLYVTYFSDGDWLITETHLAIATQPEDLPQTRKGNAIPGRFAYKTEHQPGVTEVTHTIDLSAWPEGTQLYIAAHSVVVSASAGSETAWGEGLGFPGDDWAMYFTYTVQPCSPPPVYPGVIEFDEPDISVLESSTSVTVHLVRNDGSDGDVAVTLDYGDFGATMDEDYQAPVTTVFFGDGETAKDVEIFILDDAIDELDESFIIQIIDVAGAEIGPQNEMTCTIVDDDEPPPNPGILNFAQDTLFVNENEMSVTIELVRSDGSDGEVAVTLAYDDLSATRDDDYQAPVTTVLFNDGETVKQVELFILDDAIDELDESFSVQIIDVVGAEIGSQTEVICTIVDDDEPPVNPGVLAFVNGFVVTGEDALSITIEVVRTDGSDGMVSVDYVITGVTATPDVDYLVANGTLYFEEGETSRSFTITIVDDNEQEGNEMLSLELTNPVSATLGSPFLADVIILDNDSGAPQ